jgi:MFS transporter, DHA2 family, multidrug resistance protein
MFLAARLGMRVDQRKIMAVGLVILGWVLYTMSTWTPDITPAEMMFIMIIQGFAVGLVFNPMTVMAYTTLTPSLRGEATSVQSLARNIGSAIGISITSFTLTRSVQTTHADIAAGITPFDRVLQGNDTVQHMLNPVTRHGAALLDQMVTHQAQIIAYNNDFRLMMLSIVPPLLLLLLMRRHDRPAVAAGD